MSRCIVLKASIFPCFTATPNFCKWKQSFSSKSSQVDNHNEPVALSSIYTQTGCNLRLALGSHLHSLGLAGALEDGRQVHSNIVFQGLEGHSFMGNLLLQFYARCADLCSARFCFYKIKVRNVFSWNFLIGMYDMLGQHEILLYCFQQMQAENVIPDSVTFVHVLSVFANNIQATLHHGKWLHACILFTEHNSNIILATSLLYMYGKNNNWELAWCTFTLMQEQDIASWNALNQVCAQQGRQKEVLHIYRQSQQEGFIHDSITLVNVLSALANPMTLSVGKQVHASIKHDEVERNVFLATALASMYGKCGCLGYAQSLFNQMSVRNVVTWNAMIALYAQHGQGQEAMHLYQQMHHDGLRVNNITVIGLLDACARERLLSGGKILHICLTKYAFDADLSVGIALINMYNKCHSLLEGQAMFHLLLVQDVIACNTMMTGYIHLDQGMDALDIFDEMCHKNMVLDNMTASIGLIACALEASLMKGKHIHSIVIERGFDLDLVVGNSILKMYGKCGCVDTAQNTFDTLPEKNLVSWNCIMALHAQHGNCLEVLGLLLKMKDIGIEPDQTSCTSVLSACSHAGYVNVGSFFILRVVAECNVALSIDHFDCVIDMVGRAGQLDEAENILTKMPKQPRDLSWTTFSSACTCSADGIKELLTARYRVELDVSGSLGLSTLPNIYVAACMKDSTLNLWDC